VFPEKDRAVEAGLEVESRYLTQVERALLRESRMRATAERTVRRQTQALASTFNLLLDRADEPGFVRGVLRAITRETAGIGATFWRLFPEKTPRREMHYFIDEESRRDAEIAGDWHARELRMVGRLHQGLIEEHRCTVVLRADDSRIPATIRRLYANSGVRSLLLLPLLVGERILGWIVYLTASALPEVRPETVAFMETAAQQAGLAIHLHFLNDRAQEMECALESEQLARSAEEEMRRISRLMKISLTSLDDVGSLDQFLQDTLRNMVELLRGEAGGLWQWDESFGIFAPRWVCRDGEARALSEGVSRQIGCVAWEKHRSLVRLWATADGVQVRKRSTPAMRRYMVDILDGKGELPGTHLVTVPLNFGEATNGGFVQILTSMNVTGTEESLLAVQALALQAKFALRVAGLAAAERSRAIAEERSKMARDLHDILAQSFSGILLQIEAMRAECPELSAPVSERLSKIQTQAMRSVEDVRRSILMLRPALLDNHTLTSALKALGNEVAAATGVKIRVKVSSDMGPIEAKVEMNLFAIASEAIQNAVRHAEPRSIGVSLTVSRRHLSLRIIDDGMGCAKSATRGKKSTRFGISNMRERARAIGGRLSWTSPRTGGTRVGVSIPLSLL
jgi:signal transduction histidine kinase